MVLLPVTTLVLALCIHPLFAAVLLPVYLVISVGFPLLALKIGRPVGLKYRERLGEMKALVLESVYGIKDIQIFGHGAARLARVQAQNRRINRAAHGLTIHRQTVASAPTFFVYLARILLLAVATYLAANGAQNPVGTVVISFVATASFSSTFSLTTVISSLLETFAAAERLFAIEDTEPEVVEAEHPKKTGEIREIAFEGVDFSYRAGAEPILRGFSLTVRKGDWVGIVGESGAGKSTILRLLLRFWNPMGGDIRLNGVPIGETDLGELRGRIAMLEQDTLLINASIADNIALGKPDATREEIRGAARRAGLDDFIQTLPEGYDTQMGQMRRAPFRRRAPARGHRARAAGGPGRGGHGRADQQPGRAPRKGAAQDPARTVPRKDPAAHLPPPVYARGLHAHRAPGAGPRRGGDPAARLKGTSAPRAANGCAGLFCALFSGGNGGRGRIFAPTERMKRSVRASFLVFLRGKRRAQRAVPPFFTMGAKDVNLYTI